MSRLVTRASIEEVEKVVEAWSETQGFDLLPNETLGTAQHRQIKLTATSSKKDSAFDAVWRVWEDAHGSEVEVSFRLTSPISLLLLVGWLAFLLPAVLVMQTFLRYWSAFNSSMMPKEPAEAYGVLAALIGAGLAFMIGRIERDAANMESSFVAELEGRLGGRLQSGLSPHSLPIWSKLLGFSLLGLLGFFLAGLVPAHTRWIPWVFLGALFYPDAAKLVAMREGYGEWKMKLASHLTIWTWLFKGLFMSVLVLAVAASIVTRMAGKMLIEENPAERSEYHTQATEIQSTRIRTELHCLPPLPVMLDWLRKGTQGPWLETTASEQDTEFHVSPEQNMVIAGSVTVLLALVVLFVLSSLAQVVSNLRDEVRKTKYPEAHVGEVSPFAKASGIRAHRQARWASAMIAGQYLLAAGINVVGIVFAIDLFSYLDSAHTLISQAFQEAFAWLYCFSTLTLGDTVGPRFAAGLLLLVGAPVWIGAAKTGQRVFCALARTVKNNLLGARRMGERVPESLASFISNTCRENQMPEPTVIVVPISLRTVSVRGHLFSDGATLWINRNALGVYTEGELQCLIAHELGHVKQGLWKIEWLKFLSILAFFPNYFLTLCLDTIEMELAADRFALEVTEKGDSLAKAILRSTLRREEQRKWWESVTSWLQQRRLGRIASLIQDYGMMWDFFFGEGILGYSHPLAAARLRQIELLQENG